MNITKQMIEDNQKYINFWTAFASFFDLSNLENTAVDIGPYGEKDNSYIFKREFTNEDSCIKNYCLRSRIIKSATETCELFCKAILIENGLNWDNMKTLSHNLLKCYESLPVDQKMLLEKLPFENFMNDPYFYSVIIDDFFAEYEECDKNGQTNIKNYLQAFSQGGIISNIKSRYPGEDLVDFEERFILVFSKLLHALSLSYYTNYDYFIDSLSYDEKTR